MQNPTVNLSPPLSLSTVSPVCAAVGPPAVGQVRPAGPDEEEAAASWALHYQEWVNLNYVWSATFIIQAAIFPSVQLNKTLEPQMLHDLVTEDCVYILINTSCKKSVLIFKGPLFFFFLHFKNKERLNIFTIKWIDSFSSMWYWCLWRMPWKILYSVSSKVYLYILNVCTMWALKIEVNFFPLQSLKKYF